MIRIPVRNYGKIEAFELLIFYIFAVCCGVKGRALASNTDVRLNPSAAVDYLPLPADNSKEVLRCHEKGW